LVFRLANASMRPIRPRAVRNDWRNIAITLKTLGVGILSVMAFHEKAGRSQVGSFVFSLDKVCFLPPSSHCRHASIRTLEERLVRSVQIGRSRYSRCCHLIGALWFCSSRVEPWARPLTQSPELGFGFFDFPLPGTVLTWFSVLSYAAAAVARLLLCNGS
jgi:hypothetical protein